MQQFHIENRRDAGMMRFWAKESVLLDFGVKGSPAVPWK
jgi:hypothetical protein